MASVGASLGAGSGADLTSLLNNLMTAEKIPLVALQKKEAAQQSKITAYGTLSSALSTFSAAVAAVNESKFNTAKATSSDPAIATVTTKLGAATGNLSLKVDSLATNAKVASARAVASDNTAAKADSTIGTGTLKITMGKATSSPAGFEADADRESITVEITPENATLQGIRDAVNAKGGPVSASIVNDGTGARLVFSSNATGAKNNFKIETTSAVTTLGPGLAQFAYNPAAPGNAATTPSQITLGADAALTLDGMAITNPSNTLTDVIDGLTITLLKAGTNNGVASTTTISVSQDNGGTKSAVQSIATAYNALLASTKTLSLSVPQDAGSTDTRTDGPLSGDSAIRSIMNEIKAQLTAPMAGAIEPYTSLSTIGMEFQKDGTLKLNETVFDKALATNRDAVTKLFTDKPNGEGSQGITARLAATVTQMTGENGQVKSRVDSLTTVTKQLQKQQTDMSARLVQIEARYRAQFTALDTMLTSLNTTSSFLNQQLDALSDLRKQS